MTPVATSRSRVRILRVEVPMLTESTLLCFTHQESGNNKHYPVPGPAPVPPFIPTGKGLTPTRTNPSPYTASQAAHRAPDTA